jgi:hypothetical protein
MEALKITTILLRNNTRDDRKRSRAAHFLHGVPPKISVADPDPYVSGPPESGSGSMSQGCGS